MNRSTAIVAVACAALLAASCSLPRVYRLTVQQGNVITQEMVDDLKPGMTREQVAYVMGQPVIRNPFGDDRWDYVYTLRVPGYLDEQLHLSVFFEDGKLSRIAGDFKPSDAETETPEAEAPDAADAAASADSVASGDAAASGTDAERP